MYTAVPLWWPALNDALLSVIAAKGATVRLLVSKWNHTNSLMLPNLAALQAAAAAVCPRGGRCPSSARDNRENGGGSLEVRIFEIPGWNETEGVSASYPPYSRVNHAKYIVSDTRTNIGTSNMAWGYFWNTAGASFNTDHVGLRQAAQSVFDRDWGSPYAHAL